LRADQRAIKQILLNLLSNAVKFTNKGGRIDVTVRKSGTMVSNRGPRHRRRYRGPHPAPPDTNRSSRAQATAARMHGGSGLGLALVKSLTQLHGGDLRIESEEGRGTEVTATILLNPSAEATRARLKHFAFSL